MRIPKAELVYQAQMAIAKEVIADKRTCIAHPMGKDRLVFLFIGKGGQVGNFWLYKKDALIKELYLAGVLES